MTRRQRKGEPKAAPKQKYASDLEHLFIQLWHKYVHDLPSPVPEYHGIPGRNHRFDFAFPFGTNGGVVVEMEGMGGRHNTVKGFTDDCTKYNLAIMYGWRVFRYTRPMIRKEEDGKTCISQVAAMVRSLINKYPISDRCKKFEGTPEERYKAWCAYHQYPPPKPKESGKKAKASKNKTKDATAIEPTPHSESIIINEVVS